MNHTFWLWLILAAILNLISSGVIHAQTSETPGDVQAALVEQETVRVIVALRESVGSADIAVRVAEVERVQEQVLDDLSDEAFTLIHAYDTLPGLVGEVTAEGMDNLLAQPAVAAVALDMPVYSALDESRSLIGADMVQRQLGFTGAGVNVAVLDTGVEVTHPDLADNIIAEKCFNRGGCPPDDSDQGERAADNNGHGSHIAGIISGRGQVSPLGLAPEAGIVAVRVLNNSGTGFTSDVLAGLDWVVANQSALDVKIINLSLGGGSYSGVCDDTDATTRLYAQAAAAAQAAGMTLFAASGNSGWPQQMMAPACVSSIISVGSTYDANLGRFILGNVCTDEDAVVDQVACSSNSSPELDILAPGMSILAVGLNGGQSTKSGTSMSTGQASAVAALMLEADPTLRPDDIETILKENGVPLTDERNGRVTPRIDALSALLRITGDEIVAVTGSVLLQGRTDHGGSQIFLSDLDCADTIASDPALLTEADGRFELSVLTGQSFACLRVVQPGYLSGQYLSPAGDLGRLTLLGGDLNGDDLIDIFDLSMIGFKFDSDDPLADINADGLVDIFDLVIAAANYNQAGPLTGWE